MRLSSVKPHVLKPCHNDSYSCTSHVTQKLKQKQCTCTLTTIYTPQQQQQQQHSLNIAHSPSIFQALKAIQPNLNRPVSTPVDTENRLANRWMEYQGASDWAGLLNPLDDGLRAEIIRYGNFVEAAYRAFEFDPSSPSYASCKHPNKKSLLDDTGFPNTGYRVTRHLRATSGIEIPSWAEPTISAQWATNSSWIGYVAVCQDKAEIARLGRRDVVIALRGTATCLEWLENLRATLAPMTTSSPDMAGPMVESGFLSLYTSGTASFPSLQDTIRDEVGRVLEMYPDEPISFTITGHSLGAALATLAAYDIKLTFETRAPLVTVISFGGPRVGNRSFRSTVDKQGTKILRVVNPNDVITKLPGFLIDNNDDGISSSKTVANTNNELFTWPSWIQKSVLDTQWAYAEVGCELRLATEKPEPVPFYLSNMDFAKCHDLKTYLKLVGDFSSRCPLRAATKKMISRREKFKLFS